MRSYRYQISTISTQIFVKPVKNGNQRCLESSIVYCARSLYDNEVLKHMRKEMDNVYITSVCFSVLSVGEGILVNNGNTAELLHRNGQRRSRPVVSVITRVSLDASVGSARVSVGAVTSVSADRRCVPRVLTKEYESV